MRRIEQLRVNGGDVCTLVVVTFFAYFVAPSRWMLLLMLVCAVAVGFWALLCRKAVLGRAKTAPPQPGCRCQFDLVDTALNLSHLPILRCSVAFALRGSWR